MNCAPAISSRFLAALFTVLALMVMLAGGAHGAGQSDGEFQINPEVVSSGGGVSSSQDRHSRHTTGQAGGVGYSSDGTHQDHIGFWEVPEPSLPYLQFVALGFIALLRAGCRRPTAALLR